MVKRRKKRYFVKTKKCQRQKMQLFDEFSKKPYT